MIPQLAMASQQTSGFAQRVATGVPAGGTVLPDLKALDQHIGDTRTAELNPTTRVVAQMQGTTREFIAISAYEGCTDVITGANIGVQTPLMTSVMHDDYGRAVAGAPAQGQDLYGTQSTPGNLIATGTKNTGKVAFLSGLFAGDGAAVDPYGTFNFTDPVTGKSYSARTKADSIQQQPRVRAVIGDGLVFGPSAGQTNVGKPITVNLADKMGLQFLDDGNGGKAVATLADLTSIGYDETGALTSLLGKGGNGSEHFKVGDAIWFLPGPPPTTAPTLTLHAGSGLVADTIYDYAYAVTTAKGDTGLSPIASIAPSGSTRSVQIDVASLPAGTVGTGIRVVRRVSARTGSPAGTWKTVQALTGPLTNPFSLVDSTPSTALGADYTESPTTINVKLYAQQNQPFSASVALPGTTPPLFPYNGLMIGDTTSAGGNNNGLALDLAAYTTPVRTGLLAPIIPDTVTPLLNGAGTKKLVSGLKIGGGDDHNGEQIDIAVNAAGKPMGVKIGQGVDGNGLAAFPDMSTIDYRASDGALESIGLSVPPPYTLPPTPPVPTTAPPGTTCDGGVYDPVTGATNQTCTTVVSTTVPGSQDGTTNITSGGGPPGTVPTVPAVGQLPLPGYKCDGTTTSIVATDPPLTGNVGPNSTVSANVETVTSHSDSRDQIWVDTTVYGSDIFIWAEGYIHNFTPFANQYVSFGVGTMAPVGGGNNGTGVAWAANGSSGSWILSSNRVSQGALPTQIASASVYWAFLWSQCDQNVYIFMGNEPGVLTYVGSYAGGSNPTNQGVFSWWDIFPPTGTKNFTWQVNRLAEGIPNDVKLINWAGGTYQGSAWVNPDPLTSGTATGVTTVNPPATVSGNLNVLGNLGSVGQSLNGFVAAGLITGTDVNSPFGIANDSFAKITDPFTGIDYTFPISMIPNGAPGAMSGGYFWPGA